MNLEEINSAVKEMEMNSKTLRSQGTHLPTENTENNWPPFQTYKNVGPQHSDVIPSRMDLTYSFKSSSPVTVDSG